MTSLEFFGLIAFTIQIIHSIEELATGFYKKWYFKELSFHLFLAFEVIHTLFWTIVFLSASFPGRELLIKFFLLLMFANGVQHIVWAGSFKKYVPGLLTAGIHIINFLFFYFA